MRRFMSFIGIFLLACLYAIGGISAYAEEAPEPGCNASATCLSVVPGPPATTAPGTLATVSLRLLVTGGAADHIVLTTTLPTELAADGASVRLDGVPLSTATVQGAQLRITLDGAQISGAGQYDLDFDVFVLPDTANGSTFSSDVQAQFSTADAPGAPTSAAPATLVITTPQPAVDVSLSHAGAAPQSVARTPNGPPVVLDVSADQAIAGVLTVVVPDGFLLEPDGVTDLATGSALPCQQAVARTITCPTDLAGDGSFGLALVADPAAAIGIDGALEASLEPVGQPDLSPGDNSVSVPVRVAGSAHLAYTLSPSDQDLLDLPVGARTTFTVTATNEGPDPVAALRLHAMMVTQSAEIQQATYSDANLVASGLGPRSYPSLAVGESVTFTFTVQPNRAGSSYLLGVWGETTSVDAAPQCADDLCDFAAQTNIRLVASGAAPTSGPTPGPTPPPMTEAPQAHGPSLAATGLDLDQMRAAGFTILVAGLLLLRASRRPRRGHR